MFTYKSFYFLQQQVNLPSATSANENIRCVQWLTRFSINGVSSKLLRFLFFFLSAELPWGSISRQKTFQLEGVKSLLLTMPIIVSSNVNYCMLIVRHRDQRQRVQRLPCWLSVQVTDLRKNPFLIGFPPFACTFTSRKTARERTGLPDELHSNKGSGPG